MTHAPPVPQGNQSPYPIAEPPHTRTTPSVPQASERPRDADDGRSAGRMVATLAALGTIGVAAYLFISRSVGDGAPQRVDRKSPARKPRGRGSAKSKDAKSKPTKPKSPKAKTAASSAKPARKTSKTGARGPRDGSLIALGEDHEIAYWTKRFGVDRDALHAAVAAVGNSARAVAERLGTA